MSDEMKLSERVRRGDFAEWRGNDIYGYPVYGINPFRVADEIAALEKRLEEATKFIQDIADGGGFTGAAAKDFLESTHD